MISKSKKFGLGAVLASIVFTFIFGLILLYPTPAKAQYHDYVGWAGYFKPWTLQQTAGEKEKTLLEKIKTEGLLMVMSAIMNGLNYFTNKIAYDMAVYLAAGDFGQGPFASQESFGNYLAQTAGDALGEALATLSEDLGLDLCNLPDLRLDLMLKLGFHFNYGPPTPRCTWQQLKSAYNVENIRSKYASVEGLTSRLGMGVQVEDSDFGVWFSGKEKMDTMAAETTAGAQLDREEGSGIFAMTEIISRKNIAPATVMREEFTAQSAANKTREEKASQLTMTAAALEKGGASLALNTVSTFVNTLLGTVINNFITKGMLPGGAKVCNPGLSISGVGWDQCEDDNSAESMATSYYSSGSAGTGNRRAAQEMFSELLKPKITTLDNYDISPNMAECSEDNLSPEACIVDQSFMQILQQANTGEPFTIKQAMERGFLHGDWKLIPESDAANNQKFDCSQSAYCHRNIRYLRLARVLPLGFEIAAYSSPQENPVTLKEVVDNYYTEGSLYYHLINPHWVIKLPKMRCKSFVYSAISADGVRLQTCADIQHCVGFNKDGSCSSWGYCLREKPIWKFKADYCDAQYNTCRAFTNSAGDTIGYLTRTLDTEQCNAENDGCTHYITARHYFTPTTTDWYLPVISTSSNSFTNTSISFNKKATTCKTTDDGCSAFKVASDSETLIYLKKAPNYLFCYDADATTLPNKYIQTFARLIDGVSWPKNLADLNLLRPADAGKCNDYAQVCLPEEENCNLYTSALTQEIIPGKFTPAVVAGGQVTWNDQCDAKCVGYAAYQEVASNYSNANPLSYIIPASGKSCGAADAGCSAFTNLTTDQGGLEQTEYFSYLRLCMLPDANKQKNFYVYESSETSGYQLKTYTFEKDASGGPKQIFHDTNELALYESEASPCNSISYLAGTANPDCHQFNDDSTNTYYAMLSKTVIVSDQCTPYRLNSPELVSGFSPTDLRCPYDFEPTSVGKRAGDAIELKENSCYYMGFTGNTNGAGDAQSCTKEAESCRAYKGNAGNNVRSLASDSFESTISNWSGSAGSVSVATSTESTQLGGHSLKISANVSSGGKVAIRTGFNIQQDKSYILSFWAKGNLSLDDIQIGEESGEASAYFSGPVTVSDVWRYYSFGPVEYNGPANTGKLRFLISLTGGETKLMYIDNVNLKEVTDYIYLVKNSLSVDPICDSNLSDNLPGEALSCMAYVDPAKNTYYLTNFSYLCREEAVGCTALLDTQNTPEQPLASAYNVWLKGESGTVAEITIEGTKFSCQVPVGKDGCYTNILGINDLENLYDLQGSDITLTNSTIIIPPDTPTTSPIYLVASKDVTCKAENMGCQVLGKGKFSPSGNTFTTAFGSATHYEVFEDTAVKNDPALYDTSLCRAEEIGCKSWKSGESVYYFKDPVQNGKLICKYVEPSAISYTTPAFNFPNPFGGPDIVIPEMEHNFSFGGWVWKDVGICTGGGKLCMSDSDCGEGKTCLFKNQVPCASDYSSATDGYGLWSNGNVGKYKGFVGECPVEQNGCTEFVDHSSATDEKKCALSGKKCENNSDCSEESEEDICIVNSANAYYLLDNTNLSEQMSLCNGQVSAAEGCVLIDNTNQPTKMYNTALTNQESLDKKEALVNPVASSTANDANIIIKVIHDRVCGEWAYCDLKQEFEDEETGEASSRCFHLGVCNKAGAVDAVAGKVVKDCAETVPLWTTKGQILSAALYRSVFNAWNSLDFSGYSTYGFYQVPDLTARKVGDTFRMVYVNTQYSFYGGGGSGTECIKPTATDNHNGDSCGTTAYSGHCYNGECLRSWAGYYPEYSSSLGCRAYSEMMSPFPYYVFKDSNADMLEFKDGFEDVNVCKTNNGNQTQLCEAECGYRKIKTDGAEVYEPISRPIEGNYICSTGLKAGLYCSGPESTGCGEGNSCSTIKSFQILNGWMGYCMERDETYRINGTNTANCMTWWPLESPPGVPNSWDQDPKAGYQINEGKKDRFMCLNNLPPTDLHHFGTVFTPKSHNGAAYDATLSMPKNNSYYMFLPDTIYDYEHNVINPEGDDDWVALYGLDDNTWVTGCYDNNGGTDWEVNQPTSGFTSSADLNLFKFDMPGGKKSHGMFCPLNASTLAYDTDVKFYCDYTLIDDATGRTICGTTEGGVLYHSGFSQFQDTRPAYVGKNLFSSGHPTYLNRREIERIDVHFDENSYMPKSKGWVSFISDMTDADEGERYFVSEENWAMNGGDSSYHSVELESTCEGKQYKAWEWKSWAGDSTPQWANSNKNKLITNGVCTDQFREEQLEVEDEDQGISVRVVWDDQYNLRGIWMNFENQVNTDAHTIGFFFVIHFTNGACKKYAQVSDTGADENNGKMYFKPFTNRLASGASLTLGTDGTGNDLSSRQRVRTPTLNESNYGLMEADPIAEDLNAVFINPFTVADQYHTVFSQAGSDEYSYAASKYGVFEAGVPLTVVDNMMDSICDTDCQSKISYTQSTIEGSATKPIASMLRTMFAKVYEFDKLADGSASDGGFDGYAKNAGDGKSGSYDAANPTRAAEISLNIYPPRVAAPSADSWVLDKISVDGKIGGNIYLMSGSQAHIKFYAWAHGNQMPIRRIVVDKGDSFGDTQIDSLISDSLGNRKFACSEKICDDTDEGSQFPCNSDGDCDPANTYYTCGDTSSDIKKFGNTDDTGCKAKPWDFVTDFNCPFGSMGIVESSSTGYVDIGFESSIPISSLGIDWAYIRQNFYGAEYVCVAHPRVYVLDNWGWCAGSCDYSSNTHVKGPGCYSEAGSGSTNQCDKTLSEPWVNYDGYVIVVPLPQ
ncbi:MAG: carbohydrate binding domain-containing protein [Candidatus Magasanikbacteria bacterium]|nr:carbohydrate binding domain-containing protein [Candidatus Magasanikbacteria bacterium]